MDAAVLERGFNQSTDAVERRRWHSGIYDPFRIPITFPIDKLTISMYPANAVRQTEPRAYSVGGFDHNAHVSHERDRR